MKRGTEDHPKTHDLAERLGLELWGAVGILESLWRWTAKFAPAGDIGKFTNAAIARGIGWKGDPEQLMQALICAHWVDLCAQHVRTIHHWCAHTEDSVHMKLYRNAEYFASGDKPKSTRVNAVDRAKIEVLYSANPPKHLCLTDCKSVRTSCAHTVCALPLPLPLPLPLTTTSNPADCGKVENGTAGAHKHDPEKDYKRNGRGKAKAPYNCVKIWCDEYRKQYHSAYTVTGKDAGILTSYACLSPELEFTLVIRRFLQNQMQYLLNEGHPVTRLATLWNRFKAEVKNAAATEPPPREINDDEGFMRALSGKQVPT